MHLPFEWLIVLQTSVCIATEASCKQYEHGHRVYRKQSASRGFVVNERLAQVLVFPHNHRKRLIAD
jgi:hypothetical protein